MLNDEQNESVMNAMSRYGVELVDSIGPGEAKNKLNRVLDPEETNEVLKKAQRALGSDTKF